MSKNLVSSKKIYFVVLVLNTITSALRIYFFPGQTLFFHVALFIGTFIIIALYWEIILLLSKWLDKSLPTNQRPEARILVQVFLTFILSLVIGTLFFGGAEIYFNVKTPDSLFVVTPVLNLFTALVFNLIYFGVYYFQEWKHNLIRSEVLQREQSEVRYNALRNQLNPHFLFNALTSLNSLIFENQQLASDFLKQLSKVYRYTLQHKANETVALKTEIEFIKRFVFLLETRFATAISIQIKVREEDSDRGIVPVTSQILIENAVKHNIISPNNPLSISIITDGDHLIVTNNKRRKSQVETSNKQGLENLKALYAYLAPTPVVVEDTDNQFTIKIPLI